MQTVERLLLSARRHPYASEPMPSPWNRRITAVYKYLRLYAEACEHLSQQLSVDGVVRFLQIEEAHAQGNFPLSRPSSCSRRTNMSAVDRAGRKSHCSSRVLPYVRRSLAVVSQAGRDDYQQHIACMDNKRNPSVVVAAIRGILLVKDRPQRSHLFSCC